MNQDSTFQGIAIYFIYIDIIPTVKWIYFSFGLVKKMFLMLYKSSIDLKSLTLAWVYI